MQKEFELLLYNKNITQTIADCLKKKKKTFIESGLFTNLELVTLNIILFKYMYEYTEVYNCTVMST